MAVLKIFLVAFACLFAMSAHAQNVSRENVRQLTKQAAIAAQITPGVMVCKRFTLGLASEDWVRGRVLTVDAEFAQLRIIDPGQHLHEWQGRLLARGSEIAANLADWIPCR